MKKLLGICALILATCNVVGCTHSEQTTAGTLGGAVVGGVAGNAITGGSAVGTIGGTIAGGYVGNRLSQ